MLLVKHTNSANKTLYSNSCDILMAGMTYVMDFDEPVLIAMFLKRNMEIILILTYINFLL